MRKGNMILSGLALTTCVFSIGCGLGNHGINIENTELQVVPSLNEDTSPITFDWYINFSWFTPRWGEDITSKYVTDKTGVSINFITPPNDSKEFLSTLTANEDLPDFITIESWDYIKQNLIDNDLVYSLDELSDKYDVYFTEVADKHKLDWYREENGHVYAYPNAAMSLEEFEANKDTNTSNQTFLVRKDIYEAIGKPDMRTPEGFINALLKAEEMFPEVNGEPLIPLGLHEFSEIGNYSLESYLQNFLAIPYEVDGKLYDRYSDQEYLTWLKTFRKANELGLLLPDIFVDKRLQIEEKIAKGRYFALLYQGSDMVTAQLELYKEDPNKIYIAVDGPSNSKLEEPTLEASNTISGWTITLISKSCKDPKRAIEFLSYLISEEGNKDLFLGKEGVTWDTIDGKEQFKPEVAELLKNNRNEFKNIYGAERTYWMLMDTEITNKWEVEKIHPMKDIEDWTKGKVHNFAVYDNLGPQGENQLATINKQIDDLWVDVLFKLITAKDEETFNETFSNFIETRDALGYDKVLEYKQKKLQENKDKISRYLDE